MCKNLIVNFKWKDAVDAIDAVDAHSGSPAPESTLGGLSAANIYSIYGRKAQHPFAPEWGKRSINSIFPLIINFLYIKIN